MNEIKSELTTMLLRYKAVYEKMRASKTEPIPGFLEISKRRGGSYYLHCCKDPATGKRVRTYIPKGDRVRAQRLAQQAYDQKVLKLMETRIPQLQILLEDFEDDELELAYTSLNPARRALVKPVEPLAEPWEEQVSRWMAQPYTGLGFREGERSYLTNNGEKVRSKSEKILADLFLSWHIPYKYECPLFLDDYRTFYPDFTFLDPANGQEIYWEHFGLMDDPTYAQKCFLKINAYGRHDIILYDRLLASFETADCLLDDRIINYWIQKRLLPPDQSSEKAKKRASV